MPVYAEQKEPTTFDRVVDAGLDAEIAHGLHAKEEQLLNGQEDNSNQDLNASPLVSEKIESETSSAGEESPLASPLASAEHNVIIFDWDDTLLPSSFLAQHGYRLDVDMDTRENVEFVRNELKMLEQCVITLITEALQRGKVYIITNAETDWVELSAHKFLPGVLPYLSRLTVISARSTYERMYPDSPVRWKFCAMYDTLRCIMADPARKNIMSFGDSHVEREAVRTVTRDMSNTRCKSIKFSECPNTEQLRKQQELVTSCFQYIFTHEGDLDLMLKMSMVPAGQTPAPSAPPASEQ